VLRRPAALGALALLLCTVYSASVQAKQDTAAEGRAEAKRSYEAAEREYRLGSFELALEGYRRAYGLVQLPALALNIAQCYRQLRQVERALFYYRLYLADWERKHPGQLAPYTEEVRDHIAKLVTLPTAARNGQLKPKEQTSTTRAKEVTAESASKPNRSDARPTHELNLTKTLTPPTVPVRREKTRSSFWLVSTIVSGSLAAGAEILALVYVSRANDHYRGLPPYEADRHVALGGHISAGVLAASAVTSLVLYLLSNR
jgi:tetratricopeptide (TPR) repeat protein